MMMMMMMYANANWWTSALYEQDRQARNCSRVAKQDAFERKYERLLTGVEGREERLLMQVLRHELVRHHDDSKCLGYAEALQAVLMKVGALREPLF